MSDYRRNTSGRTDTRRPASRPSSATGSSNPRQSAPQRRPAGAQQRRPANAQQVRRSAPARKAPQRSSFSEIRIPMWAGIGIIALTILIVVLISVSLLTGPKDDVQANVQKQVPQTTEAAQSTEAPAATDEPQQTAPEATQETPAIETPTSEPAPVANNGLRKATIRMAGDVIIDKEMLDATYDKATDSYNFDPYFELIGDTLSSADYTMINIEASLRKGKYGYSGYPQFTTPPVILEVVKKYGADMITMCNNHMLDGYCDGLVESVGHVEAAGLDHIGGYVDEADSNKPEIYEINGIKVGFVTYTHTTNSMENYCDDRTSYLINYFKNSNCAADIANARAAGAEVIVAVTHWGEEYKREPESTTRRYAEALVAAGADVIIGGHPHMVQPAEYVTATTATGQTRTALCIYSLGNFLSQHRVQYTDSGVVFEFTIQENADGTFSITNPGYVPVYVWTFKNASGDDDYRVLPVGQYMNNPPSGMSSDQVSRMKESLQETLTLMGGNSVITALQK